MINVARGLKGEILLALVLLATALLVGGSGLAQFVSPAIRDDLDMGATTLGLVLSAGGLAGLAVIAAAVVVDRRGPHTVMPLGAMVAGAGFLLLALTNSLWWLVVASVVVGLGRAGVASLILYAVAAKGCYRLRGTVIGALAFLIHLGLGGEINGLVSDVLDWQWVAVALGGLALAGAIMLFILLPRVFPVRQHQVPLPHWRPAQEDERPMTMGELVRLRGFWKVMGLITLVFALSSALYTANAVHLAWLQYDDSISGSAVAGMVVPLRVASAFGALFWGIASDFVRVRLLIPTASLVAVLGYSLLWLWGGSVADGIGVAIVWSALGATLSLPWVLLADHVGVRFFATIAVGVSVVGRILGSFLSLPLMGVAVDDFGKVGGAGILILLALLLAVVGSLTPRLKYSRPG